MATLPIDGGRLWYEQRGSGRPIVFLHGGWLNSDFWRPQVETFARRNRVITPDFRGHGRTGETDPRRYSIDLFVDDLERLLAHLDVEDPLLCGFSLGGMVVQSYLDRHPAAARGAVVSGPLQSMPPIPLPSSLKPFLSPVPMIASMARTLGPESTFETLLATIRATTGRQWLTVDPDVRSRALNSAGAVSPDEYGKIFRAMYHYEPRDISHVQTPVRVVYGDHEAPPVKRQGQRLAASVATGDCQEIPNAGHLVNVDQSRAYDSAVSTLLDATSRPAQPVQ